MGPMEVAMAASSVAARDDPSIGHEKGNDAHIGFGSVLAEGRIVVAKLRVFDFEHRSRVVGRQLVGVSWHLRGTTLRLHGPAGNAPRRHALEHACKLGADD